MKRKKRGEMYSSTMKYLLMAFFSFIVIVAGFKGVAFIRDRACNAELAKFELELSGIDKELRFGVKELKDFRIPCKTSQIYLFDTSKKINPGDFDNLPLMKNALATNSSKNVFIVDKGRVKKSFYAGNLEAIYPYYLCLKPRFERISFFAEGKENSAFLTAACGQPDCTLIPINISESEAQRIIQEAVYSQFGCDKCKYDYALENIKSTKEKVELFRRFIVCNGITKVEIIIKPNADVKNFRYYEYIPKECVDDLSSYLQNLELDDKVIVQKNDPLIVWHFDEIEDETIISYELSREFGESCKKIIEGLGVVQTIQRTVPPTPVCGDDSCNGLETCSTCPIDCGACSVNTLPQPTIPPASQPVPAITAQCPGGIPLGCDPVIQPRKCVALGNNQYGFVNDCQTCNCPSGWNCEGNGDCGAPATSNQCSDGTLRGECSNTKPLECRSNLVLSANAGRCGCPSGERQEDNNCVPYSQAQVNQQARFDCFQKNVWWYNSNNQPSILYNPCQSERCVSWGILQGPRKECKIDDGEAKCCCAWLDEICEDNDCTPQCTIGQKRCKAGVTNTVEECQSVNNCPSWVPRSCGSQACEDGECVQTQQLEGILNINSYTIVNRYQQGPNTYFDYQVTLSASSGTVNVYQGEWCFIDGCRGRFDLEPQFTLSAGESVTRPGQFHTNNLPDEFRFIYYYTGGQGEKTTELKIPVSQKN